MERYRREKSNCFLLILGYRYDFLSKYFDDIMDLVVRKDRKKNLMKWLKAR